MTIALDIWCIYLVLFLLQERMKSFSNSMEGKITINFFCISITSNTSIDKKETKIKHHQLIQNCFFWGIYLFTGFDTKDENRVQFWHDVWFMETP